MSRLRTMGDMLGAAKRILDAVARDRTPEGDDMNELLMLAEIEVTVENALQTSIDTLREQGVTWKSIGEALGVTGQAANMRFGEASSVARRARLSKVEQRQAAYRARLKAERDAARAALGPVTRGRRKEGAEVA